MDEELETVLAVLVLNYQHHQLLQDQIRAWNDELGSLKQALGRLVQELPHSAHWSILLEYKIPRRQKRIDAVILARDILFVIEFKTSLQAAADVRQLEDYALDLRDFHLESNGRCIVPVLVAPGRGIDAFRRLSTPDRRRDAVETVHLCDWVSLPDVLARCFAENSSVEVALIDPRAWDTSAYQPTPTIIEAATTLYSEHSVADITHSYAGAKNLALTTEALAHIICEARERREKAICFVTGVPGAGKTLAGLNAVHSSENRENGRPLGVFLSGNRPLVRIVQEAIVRDRATRSGLPRDQVRREVQTFIQNVHEFIQHHEEHELGAPLEHVVVFDEAQRAWDARKNSTKFGRAISEPRLMVDIMDRQSDWAVIVALVGGGQEIHDGEAGLGEWGRTLALDHPHWRVYVSPDALRGGPSVAGSTLFQEVDQGQLTITEEPALHLEVSLRSYRARQLAAWVNMVLAGRPADAMDIAASMPSFPVFWTRDVAALKSELRLRTRGSRRCGLVASSGAIRLRAEGIEVSSGFRQAYQYDEWFLGDEQDVRSSYQLEVAATEFEIQGLELDWTGVCWGGDFTWGGEGTNWRCRRFSGSRWQAVREPRTQEYLRNKYRVLLTRAREGVIIWIPSGCPQDGTRDPGLYDETARYLARCGVRSL